MRRKPLRWLLTAVRRRCRRCFPRCLPTAAPHPGLCTCLQDIAAAPAAMSIPEAIKGARVSLRCSSHGMPIAGCTTLAKHGRCCCCQRHLALLPHQTCCLHPRFTAALLLPAITLQVELAKLPPLQRIPLLARYARIFAAELLGTVLAVPFGLRAFSLHRSLPDARQQRAGSSVSILRDVRWGREQGQGWVDTAWVGAG